MATSDLAVAVDGADVLIICSPHQFVRGICKGLQATGKVGAGGSVSMVDGMEGTQAGGRARGERRDAWRVFFHCSQTQLRCSCSPGFTINQQPAS